MERNERRTLYALALVTLALRVLAYFRYRFDSDEPQHLHVAWGWTAGLVQYRDFFDNHAPLFHMLSAPLLHLFGERDDILRYMRAPMVVLFVIVVGATWMIGKRWWSERVAAWSVILLCTFAPFFLKSLEYRTDNLWTAVWMLALVALLMERPFIAGLLLGIALCVSLKTLVLIATLAIAAIVVKRINVRRAMWIAAGVVIAPAIVAAYFASLGAWHDMLFCVFKFNELVTRTHAHVMLPRLLYPFLLALVIWRARKSAAAPTPLFLGVFVAIYTITVFGFWVLISPRDFLPVMPLLAIALAAATTFRMRVALAIAFLIFTAYYAEWFRDAQREKITMIHQALTLTRPGEPLMDYKGETIYRRRPYYFIFEKIGRDAMQGGLLRDTVAESMIREKCHVAQADGAFWPPKARAFLAANFLDMGRLRAAGQWIHEDGSFSIAIDGDYAIVDRNGVLSPARHFVPGSYRFDRKSQERIAVVWAPAIERGFSPFKLRDRDF